MLPIGSVSPLVLSRHYKTMAGSSITNCDKKKAFYYILKLVFVLWMCLPQFK